MLWLCLENMTKTFLCTQQRSKFWQEIEFILSQILATLKSVINSEKSFYLIDSTEKLQMSNKKRVHWRTKKTSQEKKKCLWGDRTRNPIKLGKTGEKLEMEHKQCDMPCIVSEMTTQFHEISCWQHCHSMWKSNTGTSTIFVKKKYKCTLGVNLAVPCQFIHSSMEK